ncbi:MAG: hypothetical protein QW666_04160 [Candidatus Woesearchaeota archaeon]
MKKLKESIITKPWPVSVKKRTINIIDRAKERKTGTILFIDEFVYFFLLFTGVLGNFFISVTLVPLMLIMSGFYLYASLFLIGLAFGALINGLLKELQKIEEKRHIIPSLLLGAVALINIYIMTRLANILEAKLELLTPTHSPLLVSIVYVAAFLIPYFYSEYKRRF